MAEKYAEALVALKPLLAGTTDPSAAHTLIAKYAAEAALNTGDRAYAFNLLKPIEAGDSKDWQARSLLARAYNENGQKAERDAELTTLIALHKDATLGVSRLTQIVLERDTLANGGSVRIWYSLEPWGRYKTYIFSRIYNAAGDQTLRVSLESSDFDQPQFVKEHPDLAAKGARRFSMDGYGPDVKLANGGVTQSHMTFGFFDGQPTYDLVRDRILAIAQGKASSISRTDPSLGPAAK